MRRNENQPRTTAGCLSVPLFNQKKRSRLPLTSNPSESEVFSGYENRDMLSFTSAIHPSTDMGSGQPSMNRAPLAQISQWNQQTIPPTQQSKLWPTASTGRGYTPILHAQKRTYAWSQTGPQRPPGRQDPMATTPGFKQDDFLSGSSTAQIQNKTLAARQPVKQQSFSRNVNPPRGSFAPSAPAACSQRPAAQTQSSQWKIKSGGLGRGMWVEDTFNTSQNKSRVQQQEKATPRKSLRILTAVIEGMKHWSQFKDKVPMMFEIFATLDSAVTVGKFGAKSFLMRDRNDAVPCVYYENDQVLPRLIRGQVHRCVGNYDRQKNVFTCVSVRAASLSEQRNAQEAVRASDAEMRSEVLMLSEM
ncbi:spermatogenesis-associated protein 22 isoform X1 [Clarias gariepinus]|uniref:spermatogenesis-associated protein 22 isoform X1 n=1 Tax=Clarias gariepinus TaxID=13013 RepID=UPI00234CEE28|nr:spermatogenesis-associated protein 22 isoform X1 [Clarias gariepinus]XP_053340727.1 spermatogenesis-associated protein 22 isoform X1 [Clarias gariepinus]